MLFLGFRKKVPTRVSGAFGGSECLFKVYEGPTGIIGVLNDAFHRGGFDSLSFWAAVPSYIGHNPSPKAALALVQRVVDFLDIPLGATDLQIAAASSQDIYWIIQSLKE